MAFDTEQKRHSALTFDEPWGMAWPTGLDDQAYRQDAMGNYAGLLAPDLTVETDTDQSGIVKIGAQAWRYTWSGTSPFYLYTPGWQIGAGTTDTSIILEGEDQHEAPLLEVLDSTDTADALDVQNPSTVCLQWRGDSSHAYYAIEENVSGTWTHRTYIREIGIGYYEWETEAQPDGTSANWRVLSYDTEENESRSMEFTVIVVRNPEPPTVWITYNPVTGNVTVSQRSGKS